MSSFESVLNTTDVCWCVVALAAWLAAAWLHYTFADMAIRVACLLPRIAAAFAFWLMVLRVTDGLIGTSASFPFCTISLVAAIVTEVVFWCYAAEHTFAQGSRRRGLSLATFDATAANGFDRIACCSATQTDEVARRGKT